MKIGVVFAREKRIGRLVRNKSRESENNWENQERRL